jgi:serine protease Do
MKGIPMNRQLLQIVLYSSMLTVLVARPALAETLKITSTPPAATVEIDGVKVGTTPYELKLPGGYFHKNAFGIGSHLEHSMRLRVSKEGFTSKEIEMTDGPIPFIGYTAFATEYHGECWVLKANHFDAVLEPVSKSFTGTVLAKLAGNAKVEMRPELAVEDIVQQSKPAVVLLRGSGGHGSGFFVTETGVIATNAHVARGESSLVAELPTGQELDAKIVYIDDDKDVALVKVEGSGFQHLTLSETSTVRQGQTVVALGNPGLSLPFSATKGIVSAIGLSEGIGRGTWIQTDAAINPGNSGGPLLNSHAEVVGINTQKVVEKGFQGIGFALSSNDLIEVVSRFYPAVTTPNSPTSVLPNQFGTISVSSDPDGADVYLDGKFVGNTPEILKIPTGEHAIRLAYQNRIDWERSIEILADSQLNVKAQLTASK